MNMLKHFFEYGCDPQLFEGLAISAEPLLCQEHMGKYPVISITLKDVSGNDYKTALEMLRSEGAFADIPVIFLTGRSDPELVRTLLSLKPAGYLLKYLKPHDIKQKIGRFFETGRMTDRS